MGTIETWVFRIADSNTTWIGLNWLRPAKQARIGMGYIILSSILLGLPGVAAGAGLIYWFLGQVPGRVIGLIFIAVVLVELFLHLLFAHFWNRRAQQLGNNAATA